MPAPAFSQFCLEKNLQEQEVARQIQDRAAIILCNFQTLSISFIILC